MRATVLMFEPVSEETYSTRTMRDQAGRDHVSGNAGFSADRKWQASSTGVLFVHAEGLGMGRGGMRGTGLSVGWNYSTTTGDGSRGIYRQLADGVMPTSGTLFFRCLIREGVGAVWTGNGPFHRRVGFQAEGHNGNPGSVWYYQSFPTTGPHFVLQKKTSSSSSLQFRYGAVVETLVDEVRQGATYLCLAKIQIGALENGHDRTSALAADVEAWDWDGRDEPAWTFEGADPGLSFATAAKFPDKLQIYGAYETGGVPVAFDEIMLATELAEAVPSTRLPTVIVVR